MEHAKLELIQWLTTLENEDLLKQIIQLKESDNQSVYHLTKEERISVEKGLEDLRNGDVVSHDEVRKGYEKWL